MALLAALYNDFHPRKLRLYVNAPVGDDDYDLKTISRTLGRPAADELRPAPDGERAGTDRVAGLVHRQPEDGAEGGAEGEADLRDGQLRIRLDHDAAAACKERQR